MIPHAFCFISNVRVISMAEIRPVLRTVGLEVLTGDLVGEEEEEAEQL